MNLYRLRDLIENSSAAEWVKVEPAGVTYRYRFEVSTDRDGGEQVSVGTAIEWSPSTPPTST